MSRVLVVEDDVDIVMEVRRILEEAGYDVSSASNGIEGIEALHGPQPDLVLLDLMMPVSTGWDFLRMKELDAAVIHIPVIVITAANCLGARAREDLERTLFILHKPFSLERLLYVVDRALNPRSTSHPPPM
jgi:CheY-like chemotaxis protein